MDELDSDGNSSVVDVSGSTPAQFGCGKITLNLNDRSKETRSPT